MKNRIYNAANPYQGEYKRVLCVCSAGLLRSPTAALVLSQEPFNYNTRAAGIEESYALIPVDKVLLTWADIVVCMTKEHRDVIFTKYPDYLGKVIVLDIPDNFGYRDKQLIEYIKEKCIAYFTPGH